MTRHQTLTAPEESMSEYHKIQTIFKRDMTQKHKPLIEGEWTLPEFEYLADLPWEFTEKVDGTNIRVIYDGSAIHFAGRTDNAQLPMPLVDRLREHFPAEKMDDAFPDPGGLICLYGEGYGPKIQSGGKYRADQDFVLFDVRIGNWWLRRPDVEDIAAQLGIDVVPVIGEGTLHDAVAAVKAGLPSTWGDFEAEGIVARPRVELRARNGERIIAKIKGRDFR